MKNIVANEKVITDLTENEFYRISGSENTVYAGTGDNVLMVYGNNNYVHAVNGEQIINVTGEGNNVEAASGNDVIFLSGYDNHVSCGSGNDVVYVWPQVDKAYIETGFDTDTIVVEGDIHGTLTIDCTYSNSKDILYIKDTILDEVQFNNDGIVDGRYQQRVLYGHTEIILKADNTVDFIESVYFANGSAYHAKPGYSFERRYAEVYEGDALERLAMANSVLLEKEVITEGTILDASTDVGMDWNIEGNNHIDCASVYEDKINIMGDYNSIDASSGADVIKVNGENNEVFGAEGADIISVAGSNNTIYGGAHNDVIVLEGGTHTVQCGDGDDIVYIKQIEVANITTGKGADTIVVDGDVHGRINLNSGKGDKHDILVLKGVSINDLGYIEYFANPASGSISYGETIIDFDNYYRTGDFIQYIYCDDGYAYAEFEGEYYERTYTGVNSYEGTALEKIAAAETALANTNDNPGSEPQPEPGQDEKGLVMESKGKGEVLQGSQYDDEFAIVGGTGNVVYAGAGKDTINVAGGTKHVVNGEDGDDTIDIYGGTVKSLNLGAGDDRITLEGGTVTRLNAIMGDNELTINGGLLKTFSAGIGIDTITVNQGALTTLNGDKYIDTIENLTVNGGKVATANFALGDDNLIVNGGVVTTANMGAGDDKVTVWEGGSITNLKLNSGDNTLYLYGGYIKNLVCGTGTDTINADTGTIGKFTGSSSKDILNIGNVSKLTAKLGADDDEIDVHGGIGHKLYGGAGNDNITIRGGSNISVYGEAGNDSFAITGGMDNITVSGGKGSDSYEIMTFGDNYVYTILNSDYAKGDMDSLILKNFASTDFDYAIDAKKNMYLTYKGNGAQIVIKGWAKNPMPITFSDGVKSVDEVNANIVKELNVRPLKSGTGTAFKDIFKVSLGAKVKSTISNYSQYDVLDLTAFKEHEFSLNTSLNNLQLVVSANGKSIGYVNLKNYLTAASKLQSVLLYDKDSDRIVQYRITRDHNNGFVLEPLGVMGSETDVQLSINEAGEYRYEGNSNYAVSFMASDASLYTSAGEDTINLAGAMTSLVNAGEGNDALIIADSQDNQVYGGLGDDNMVLNSGANNEIYGEAGQDRFTVNGGSSNNLYGGDGNDQFVVNGGENNNIFGGAGADYVEISEGNNYAVWGESGDDVIGIASGSDSIVYGGEGNDVISVAGVRQHAEGGAGDDHLIINAGGNGHVLRGDSGNDQYSINYAPHSGGFIIDNSTASGIDQDIVRINGATSSDFDWSYEQVTDTLALSVGNNEYLKVVGLTVTKELKLLFMDEEFNYEALCAKLGINQNNGSTSGDNTEDSSNTSGDNNEDGGSTSGGSTGDSGSTSGSSTEDSGSTSGGNTEDSGSASGGNTSGPNSSTADFIYNAEKSGRSELSADTRSVAFKGNGVIADIDASNIAADTTISFDFSSYSDKYGVEVYKDSTNNVCQFRIVDLTTKDLLATSVFNVKGMYANYSYKFNSSLGNFNSTSMANGHVLYTSSRVDEFELIEKHDLYVYTDLGKDVVHVEGGYNNNIYTQDGEDTIYVEGTHGGSANGGKGVDHIEAVGVFDYTVHGNEDNDYIYVDAGYDYYSGRTTNWVYGDDGDDYIVSATTYGDFTQYKQNSYTGYSSNYIFGGKGNDTIVYLGGLRGSIDGGEGDDVIDCVTGLETTIKGGNGSDTYYLDWKNCDKTVIDNSDYLEGDKDSLIIRCAEFENFKLDLYKVENILIMKSDERTLTIKDWDKNPLQAIAFDNKIIYGDEIEQYANIRGSIKDNILDGRNELSLDKNDYEYKEDSYILNNSTNNTIKTYYYSESFVLNGADKNVLENGAKNIVLKASDNNNIKDNSFYSEKILLVDSSNNDVYGGYGYSDYIIIKGESSNNKIDCEYGENRVLVAGGDGNELMARDYLNSDYGNDDVVIISGGTSHKVTMGAGDDIVYVTGGSGHTLEDGKGNDTYIIDWSNAMNVSVNMTYYSEATDADIVVLENADIDNCTLNNNGYEVTISEVGKNTITIAKRSYYSDEHISKIFFDNGYLTSTDGLNYTKHYYADESEKYNGDAYSKIAAAEQEFAATEAGLEEIYSNYFDESNNLKVSGNI